MNKKNKQGGKRNGSGRKKGEPTKTKRIPIAIEAEIDQKIKDYKQKSNVAK